MQDAKFSVKVKPFAARSKVQNFNDGLLEVSLAAKPKDGEANEELRRILSEFFDVPRSKVSIESGHASRNKVVVVFGLTMELAVMRLDESFKDLCEREK